MTIQLLVGIIGLAMLGSHEAGISTPQQVLLRLADDIQSPTGVERVTIFWVPKQVLTHSALTAAQLEKSPQCEISIDVRLLPAKALAQALARTRVEPSTSSADLRWGIVFLYQDGRREAVYLDGFGKNGQVGKAKVRFLNERLLTYLDGVGNALGY